MGWMDRWDVGMLLIAAYVAVMSLVRLMARRRADLVADFQRQIDAQRRRPKQNPASGKNQDRGAA